MSLQTRVKDIEAEIRPGQKIMVAIPANKDQTIYDYWPSDDPQDKRRITAEDLDKLDDPSMVIFRVVYKSGKIWNRTDPRDGLNEVKK